MAIIISLTTPVERGVSYFMFLMAVFGILLLITMAGIIFYLASIGFSEYSNLVFAGVVMCTVFLIPMLLRPLDFLDNLKNYTLGLLSYLFMMPTFINIM